VRGQILGDSIPTLVTTFSRVMQISTSSDVSSAPSIEQSVMISRHGRDHDRDFGGRERGSVRGVDLMEADKVSLRKASCNIGIMDVVITSPKSAGRNLVDLSGHSYLSLILLPRVLLLRFSHLLIQALP